MPRTGIVIIKLLVIIALVLFILNPTNSYAGFTNILDAISYGAKLYYNNDPDNIDFETEYKNGVAGQRYKHLAILGIGIDEAIKVSLLLLIDLDDFNGITVEGSEFTLDGSHKDSYVTFWLGIDLALLHASYPPLVSLGWTRIPINNKGEDPLYPYTPSLFSANALFAGLKVVKFTETGRIEPIGFNLDTFNFGGDLSILSFPMGVFKGEIRKSDLINYMNTAQLGLSGSVSDPEIIAGKSIKSIFDYQDNMTIPRLISDSIGYRTFTALDDGSPGISKATITSVRGGLNRDGIGLGDNIAPIVPSDHKDYWQIPESGFVLSIENIGTEYNSYWIEIDLDKSRIPAGWHVERHLPGAHNLLSDIIGPVAPGETVGTHWHITCLQDSEAWARINFKIYEPNLLNTGKGEYLTEEDVYFLKSQTFWPQIHDVTIANIEVQRGETILLERDQFIEILAYCQDLPKGGMEIPFEGKMSIVIDDIFQRYQGPYTIETPSVHHWWNLSDLIPNSRHTVNILAEDILRDDSNLKKIVRYKDIFEFYVEIVERPVIHNLIPNGGEIFQIESTRNIVWETTGDTGNTVDIEISRNGGSSWQTLYNDIPNEGSKSWPVTGPESSNCLIRIISSSDNSITDTSDSTFAILPYCASHDVKVSFVESSKSSMTPDQSATVTGNVTNLGSNTETINVKLSVTGPNGYICSKTQTISLSGGINHTDQISFNWPTGCNSPNVSGHYILTISALSNAGCDADMTDNSEAIGIYLSDDGNSPPVKAYKFQKYFLDYNGDQPGGSVTVDSRTFHLEAKGIFNYIDSKDFEYTLTITGEGKNDFKSKYANTSADNQFIWWAHAYYPGSLALCIGKADNSNGFNRYEQPVSQGETARFTSPVEYDTSYVYKTTGDPESDLKINFESTPGGNYSEDTNDDILVDTTGLNNGLYKFAILSGEPKYEIDKYLAYGQFNVITPQFNLIIDKTGTGSGRILVNGTSHALPYSAGYPENTSVTIHAQPDSGSNFYGWTGDSNSTSNPITITVNSDTSLIATFNAPDFTISASPITQAVPYEDTANYSINIGSFYGFDSEVSLSLSGLSEGSYQIDPDTITAPGISTLTINTELLNIADYSFTVSGESTTRTHTSDPVRLSVLGGTVSGIVTRVSDGQPIEGLWVEAYGYPSGPWFAGAYTRPDGSYTITGLPTGAYRIQVITFGTDFVRKYYNNTYIYSAAAPVSVTAPQQTAAIDFTLALGGKISGTVKRDTDGQPIDGLRVYALDSSTGVNSSAQTDSIGAFTITGLPTGTYKVNTGGSGTDYAREYYNDVTDENSAASVPVTALQTTSDIDFSLSPGGTITGVITRESDGQPIPGLWVYADGYSSGDWFGSAYTQSDGSYTLSGLPTGSYRIEVNTSGTDYVREYYNNTYSYSAAAPVPVTATQTTSHIDFSLSLGGNISGFVTRDSDGHPIEGLWVYANDSSIGANSSARTDSSGAYTITGLPTGSYIVNTGGSQTDYVREYYDDSADENSAASVPVTALQTTSGINFSLAPGGTVTGVVTRESDAQPIPGLWVYAYGYSSGDWVSSGYTQSDGTYTLSGLPTGTYRIDISTSGTDYVREYYNNTYSYSAATPVSVTAPQQTADIDFTLALGGSITGLVTCNSDGQPLADLWVRANSDPTGVYGSVRTKSDGTYTISGLPTGTYRVDTGGSGTDYVQIYYDNVYDSQSATSVSVIPEQITPDINFSLRKGSEIRGRVTDSNGQALENMSVSAQNTEYSQYYSSQTGVDGTFSFSGLSPGTYIVQAGNGSNYVAEYFDDVSDYFSATKFTINQEEIVTGIDFSLDLGGKISGTVTDESDNPIQGLQVSASSYYLSNPFYSSRTQADGTYTISGIMSGDYRINVNTWGTDYVQEYYNNTFDHLSAEKIHVEAGQEVPGADFDLALGGKISGLVTDPSGNPVSGVSVTATHETNGLSAGAISATDGTYIMSGLTDGNYYVSTWLYGSSYVTEYYNNAYNEADATLVSVTSLQTTPNIDFQFEEGGTITGTVRDPNNAPISGLSVSAYDYDTKQFKGRAQAQTDGTYEIIGLAQDIFSVYVSTQGTDYIPEYYSNAYDRDSRTPVEVHIEDDTPNIDFNLEIGGKISGTITGPDGQPIEGISITAYDHNTDKSYGSGASSGPDGGYIKSGLPPGSYRVRAKGYELPYAVEYYQDAHDKGNAQAVDIQNTETVSDIDFQLEVGGAISGYVYEEDGVTPVVDACLDVSSEAPQWNEITTWCCTLADGSFEITGIPETDIYLKTDANCRDSNPNILDEWHAASGSTSDGNLATPVPVKAGQTISDIIFTLDAFEATPKVNLILYEPDPTNDFTPTLSWYPVSGATSYRIEINDTADFDPTSLLDEAYVSGAVPISGPFSYTPAADLPEGGIYWRVSSDLDYGQYSIPDHFVITSTPLDSDNDGMPDSWEDQYGLNPLINDADEDLDQDGFTNKQEIDAGTRPNDPNDYPPIVVKGDVDNDGNVDLSDAILSLQVLAGLSPSSTPKSEGDVNGDGKIGMAEAVYALQVVAGERVNPTTTTTTIITTTTTSSTTSYTVEPSY